MIGVRKNHKTATILVGIAAIAAVLLVAGTVVAAGSHNLAFAYKRMYSQESYKTSSHGFDTSANSYQSSRCINAGANGEIEDNACQNTAENEPENSGGAVGGGGNWA